MSANSSLFMPRALLHLCIWTCTRLTIHVHNPSIMLRIYAYPKSTSILLHISNSPSDAVSWKVLQATESWEGPGNEAKAPLILTHLTNGIVQWVSCGPIPEDGGFALAWDPNAFQSHQIPLLLQLIRHIIQTVNHAFQQLMWFLLIVAVGGRTIAVNQVITKQ